MKKDIRFSDYYNCLVERVNPKYKKTNSIRSHKYEIYSETVNKVALSAYDDKRVIGADGIAALLEYSYHML